MLLSVFKSDIEQTIESILKKFGTQVLGRKISVEFVDGKNPWTISKWRQCIKYSKNYLNFLNLSHTKQILVKTA